MYDGYYISHVKGYLQTMPLQVVKLRKIIGSDGKLCVLPHFLYLKFTEICQCSQNTIQMI